MAVLAAYDIAHLCPFNSVQVYTVGAPRPGNKAFAAKYDARVPATWHIINPKVSSLSGSISNCLMCLVLTHAGDHAIAQLSSTCACVYACLLCPCVCRVLLGSM